MGLLGLEQYLKTDGLLNPVGKVVVIIIIFLVGLLLTKIFNWVIAKRIEHELRNGAYQNPRLLTIVSMFNKIFSVIIVIICLTISLDILGINTSSIVATIGVGSLALSFGAQTLVKDCINGFFIILENQFSVGDTVEIQGMTGTIEDIGLRTTKIKDFDGSRHIIPNGQIGIVTNKQRGDMRAKVVCSISADENPGRVIEILENKLSEIKITGLVSTPSVWGVTNNTSTGYEITIVAYAEAGTQFDVEYKIRQSIVEAFNENNISVPVLRYEITDRRTNALL